MTVRRLGIFGGTFDPVHLGHVASARFVADRFGFERTLFVLSARPPHKTGAAPADAQHRLAMLQLATAAHRDFEACDLEVRRGGPSYTVDTLAELHTAHPDAELFLVLGIDAYREVDSWSRPQALLALANVIVTTRPGHTFPSGRLQPPVAGKEACCYDERIGSYVHKSGHVLASCEVPEVDVSASEIRRRLAERRSIEDLTGPAVAAYISENRLYGARPA